jgi:hypothetical protein
LRISLFRKQNVGFFRAVGIVFDTNDLGDSIPISSNVILAGIAYNNGNSEMLK